MTNPSLQIDEPDARIDELSPLIHPPPTPTSPPSPLQKNVVRLLYVIVFMLMFGQYLQPGPRTQIYENIVCRNYYEKLQENSFVGNNGTVRDHDCKARPVQEELALLRGWERFGDLFPTLLTVPYGVLADRYGRRIILFLGLLGLLMGECFGFIVSWFSEVFPIRLIWLQFAFQFIGGGSAVGNTMLHVIATDVTPAEMRSVESYVGSDAFFQPEWIAWPPKDLQFIIVADRVARTTVFFRIHGAAMGSAIVGPTVGSLLMGYNPFLPWFVAEILLVMGILLVLLLPKDLGKQLPTPPPSPGNDAHGEDGTINGKHDTSVKGRFASTLEALKPILRIITANRQLLLLFAMGLFSQVGNDSLLLVLLLVVSNRYGWSFARANYLFSISAIIQVLLLIAILPLASQFLLQRMRKSALNKDRNLVFASSLVPAIGALCVGFASKVSLAIFGVVLMSAGAGLTALLRSLISESTAPKNISVVFSIMTLLTIVGGAFGGPIYSETYSAGVRLGPAWVGLPFVVAAAILMVVFSLAIFVREPKEAEYETIPEHE